MASGGLISAPLGAPVHSMRDWVRGHGIGRAEKRCSGSPVIEKSLDWYFGVPPVQEVQVRMPYRLSAALVRANHIPVASKADKIPSSLSWAALCSASLVWTSQCLILLVGLGLSFPQGQMRVIADAVEDSCVRALY